MTTPNVSAPTTTVQQRLREAMAASKNRLRNAPLQLVGADLGNTTSLLAQGNEYVQIPSLIGTGDLEALLTLRGNDANAGRLSPGEYALVMDGQVWYFGKLAVEQSKDSTTDRGNEHRQYNGHGLRLLLALSAILNPKATELRQRAVTGLPPRQFKSRPDLRLTIPRALCGLYAYQFWDESGKRDMLVSIESVIVGMENVMVGQAYGPKGKPHGTIDVGGDTFDIAVFNRDGKLVEERTDSLVDNGAERITSSISRQFQRRYGRELTAQERDDVLRNAAAGQATEVFEQGVKTITLDEVAAAVQQVTDRGQRFLEQKWGAKPGSDLASVRLLGGTSRLVRPRLFTDTIEVSPDPEADNARAFAVFAQRFQDNGLFDKRIAELAQEG